MSRGKKRGEKPPKDITVKVKVDDTGFLDDGIVFDRKTKKKLVEALYQGHSITSACEELRVSRIGVYKARKRDPEFDKAIKEAMEIQVEIVEDVLFHKALSGDVTAMIFFLKNRAPGKWNDKKTIEHSGVNRIEFLGLAPLTKEDVNSK